MEEQDNPSKRKELEGDKLKRIIREIRECKDCEFIGFGEDGDPNEYLLNFIPCSIHKEKVEELL
jgi:hypothetical protein